VSNEYDMSKRHLLRRRYGRAGKLPPPELKALLDEWADLDRRLTGGAFAGRLSKKERATLQARKNLLGERISEFNRR
jgi:hypothetical protein